MAENARTSPFPLQSITASCPLMLYMISVSFANHAYAATFTLRSYLLHFIQIRFNINSFNQSSTLFTVPILMNFLQLKYQGNDCRTPFETHPKTMWVAVSSSIVYYIAYDIVVQLQYFPLCRFGHHCLLWCGYASVASLTSVLLPDSFSPYLYSFFVLLSTTELLYWLRRNLVMEEESEDVQTHRRRINSRFWTNSSRQRQQILPR